MSIVIVRDGDTVTQDPSDVIVYGFDWDTDNLATGVIIADSFIKVRSVVGTSIEQAVVSITRTSTTATVIMEAPHGFTTGDSITVAGATTPGVTPSPYNGTFTITVVDTLTFTYPVSGAPASPATGTMTAAAGLDSVSILASSPYDDRYTQFRFGGPALVKGAVYEVANTIVTNENPAQRKERSVRISIQDK